MVSFSYVKASQLLDEAKIDENTKKLENSIVSLTKNTVSFVNDISFKEGTFETEMILVSGTFTGLIFR